MWWPCRARQVRLMAGWAESPCNPTGPGQQAQGDSWSRGRGQGRWEWAWEKEGAERVPCHPGCSSDMTGAPQSRQCQGAPGRGWDSPKTMHDLGRSQPVECSGRLSSLARGSWESRLERGVCGRDKARVAAGPQRSWGPAWAVTAAQARVSKSRWSEVGTGHDSRGGEPQRSMGRGRPPSDGVQVGWQGSLCLRGSPRSGGRR